MRRTSKNIALHPFTPHSFFVRHSYTNTVTDPQTAHRIFHFYRTDFLSAYINKLLSSAHEINISILVGITIISGTEAAAPKSIPVIVHIQIMRHYDVTFYTYFPLVSDKDFFPVLIHNLYLHRRDRFAYRLQMFRVMKFHKGRTAGLRQSIMHTNSGIGKQAEHLFFHLKRHSGTTYFYIPYLFCIFTNTGSTYFSYICPCSRNHSKACSMVLVYILKEKPYIGKAAHQNNRSPFEQITPDASQAKRMTNRKSKHLNVLSPIPYKFIYI